MIDEDGYRPNVGIILANREGQVLWARRVGQDAWQFPQGGIAENESPEDALYRELREEIGLQDHDVEIVGCTSGWLRYRLPKRFLRYRSRPLCIGQKQKWFAFRFTVAANLIERLEMAQATPEEFADLLEREPAIAAVIVFLHLGSLGAVLVFLCAAVEQSDPGATWSVAQI